MKEKIRELVEEYQCPGCVCGSDFSCYEKGFSHSCDKHVPGTNIFPHVGRIFLGMPKGFNRVGECDGMAIDLHVWEEAQHGYDSLNVPVWKFLDKHGNTLIRGIMPRVNRPFLHVIIGNYMDNIDCIDITNELDGMD